MTAAAPALALEPMRWWHLPDVLAIEAEAFGPEAWSEELFWSELAQAATRHLVLARLGDEVVGYAVLAAYAEEAFVQTIAVAQRARRRGVARALLAELLAEADRRGATEVTLEVRDGNTAAVALYEAFGFRQVGRRRRYYQPSGADALVMAR